MQFKTIMQTWVKLQYVLVRCIIYMMLNLYCYEYRYKSVTTLSTFGSSKQFFFIKTVH